MPDQGVFVMAFLEINTMLIYIVLEGLLCTVPLVRAMEWREFRGAMYGLSYNASYYDIAQLQCQQEGGGLANVINMDVHWFLSSIMDRNKEYWLGTYRSGNVYYWTSNDVPLNNSMWYSSEPTLEPSETAVRYKYSLTFGEFKFLDRDPNIFYYYICQRDPIYLNTFNKPPIILDVTGCDEREHAVVNSYTNCARECSRRSNCSVMGYSCVSGDCNTFSSSITSSASPDMTGLDVYIRQSV